MRYLNLILIALLLTACAERIQPPVQAGEVRQLPPIEWHVVDAIELRKAYVDAGMPITANDRLYGFTGKRGDTVVVYTLPPQRVDDAATLTLGHEVLHVALGDYHKP